MFIRILYEDTEESSTEPYEVTIECSKYALNRNADGQLYINMNGDETIYMIEGKVSVWVMNREGRTIDRIK